MSGLEVAILGLVLTVMNFVYILCLDVKINNERNKRVQSSANIRSELYERTSNYVTHNAAVARWLEEEWFYDTFGIEMKEAKEEMYSYRHYELGILGGTTWDEEVRDIPYVIESTDTTIGRGGYDYHKYKLVTKETWALRKMQLGEKHINECV